MGDKVLEGSDGTVQPPPGKKRRGRETELIRVAEIVMVLSAMAEMRAGKEPAAVERALVADARERLARACEELRPKELFSSEAVRLVVEDLGLNRGRDPMLAFRPPKTSIAERLQHTKKKMEESRDYTALASASQHHSMGFGTTSESHAPQRFLAGKTSPMVLTAGGFPSSSTVVHIPPLPSSIFSMKQMPTSEAKPAIIASSVGRDSSSATTHVEAAHQRLDAQINASIVANYLPEKASGILTSAALAMQSQASNSKSKIEVNAIQTSHEMMKIHNTKGPVVHATQMNTAIENQLSQGLTFVHTTSFVRNHNEIAKCVLSIVQAKVPDCPSLSPPSTEYMVNPLNCQICKIVITDVESLLVCDACEKGTHLKCLQSFGTKAIPKADWHCPKCLNVSNGKPFPPKYGRVTRNIPVAKATSSGGGTFLLEKKGENPEPKFNNQRLMENENLSSSSAVQASSFDCSRRESATDSKVTNSKEFEESSSNWKRTEERKNPGTSVNNIEDKNGVISATPETQNGSSNGQSARINLLEAETERPGSDSQYWGSDRQSALSRLAPSETPRSASESVPDIRTQSEYLYLNQKQRIVVENAHQSQLHNNLDVIKEANELAESMIATFEMQRSASESLPNIISQSEYLYSNLKHGTVVENSCWSQLPSDLGTVTEANVPINAEVAYDQMQKTSKPRTDELTDICKSSETSASSMLEIRVDTSNKVIGNGSDTAYHGSTSVEGLHKVDWVGDILEVVDNRTYYKSFRFNGAVIRLEDHVLVSTDSQNFYPAKLLSLWEDSKILSKHAIVNQYYLPSTLPEAVHQPSIPEKYEVYASDERNTILASSICGVCDVLPEEKFRKEANRRTLLGDKADGLHSIFLFKWMFDVSKGTFQSSAQLL